MSNDEGMTKSKMRRQMIFSLFGSFETSFVIRDHVSTSLDMTIG